ncbi:hypothetical protein [Bifidobacterium thermophilum]|uniref:hypothetical protein n=1 Tax=Bifidobacterium thermophilum TaxID=33905 RepID=UPI00309AF99E
MKHNTNSITPSTNEWRNVIPALTPWGKNRVKPDETIKHALIMPGIGYTVDRPLLYWASQALAAEGWYVDRLALTLTEDVEFPEMIACMERVIDVWKAKSIARAHTAAQLLPDDARNSNAKAQDIADNSAALNDSGDLADSDGPADNPADGSAVRAESTPKLLVVTKSLSTLSFPHAAREGLHVALLTPVLNPPPFDVHKSVIPAPLPGAQRAPKPLICAGTADPYFDGSKAHLLTERVCTYQDANHSIEVPGDWARSIDYLKDVTGRIVEYSRTI